LVAAFRATLEEVTAADVIVHVRDIANPDTQAQKKQVLGVLSDLGILPEEMAGEGEPQVPLVEVWNKCDLLNVDQWADLDEEIARHPDDKIVRASALTGEGCDDLLNLLSDLLTADAKMHVFLLPASAGQKIAWLHAHGEVVADEEAGEGEQGPQRRLSVRLTPKELGRFSRQ
jgi:GTP-binding protein HflX